MSVWSREGLRGFLIAEGGCTERSAADAIKYLDSSGNPILCDNAVGGPVRVTRHPDGAYEVLDADIEREDERGECEGDEAAEATARAWMFGE